MLDGRFLLIFSLGICLVLSACDNGQAPEKAAEEAIVDHEEIVSTDEAVEDFTIESTAPSEQDQVNANPTGYYLDTLVPGSDFHGIHGLAFGPDNMIYTGSVVGQSIYRVDPYSGNATTFIAPPEGQADDLEFHPDGTLVWTGLSLGHVYARTPDGEVKRLAEGLPSVNSIAFKQDGRLFATTVFGGDALYEIDPAGVEPPRKIIENMGGLNGFDFGPDGKLYGPLWFKGQVVRVDVDTGELEVVAEGFDTPAAVNFDSQNNLFAIENETGEVFEINIESGEKTLIATAPSNLDNLAFDQDDRLYVTNMSDNGIYEIDRDAGDFRLVTAGPLTTPGGIDIYEGESGETLYVADTFSLSLVDVNSGQVSDISRLISDHKYAINVSVNDQHIVTTSFAEGVVQAYDRKTESLKFAWHGFVAPSAAVELADGRIIVAEAGTGNVLIVSGEEGKERTVLASGLLNPACIAIDGDGVAYVSEAMGDRIVAIDPSSGELTEIANNIRQPEGLDFTPNGKLIVAEVGQRQILSIDLETGERMVIAGDLPIGLPPFHGAPLSFIPTGISIDSKGDIYVASDIDNSIIKLVWQ